MWAWYETRILNLKLINQHKEQRWFFPLSNSNTEVGRGRCGQMLLKLHFEKHLQKEFAVHHKHNSVLFLADHCHTLISPGKSLNRTVQIIHYQLKPEKQGSSCEVETRSRYSFGLNTWSEFSAGPQECPAKGPTLQYTCSSLSSCWDLSWKPVFTRASISKGMKEGHPFKISKQPPTFKVMCKQGQKSIHLSIEKTALLNNICFRC